MDDRLNYKVIRRTDVSPDYYDFTIEQYDRQLALEIYKRISDGDHHVVRVLRTEERDEVLVTAFLSTTKPVYYKSKFPSRLNFWQRLRVLWTGDVPISPSLD